jgi:hypothetical protein
MSDTKPIGYNGWTNYETWCANLWMDNDAAAQIFWREQTAAFIDECGSKAKAQAVSWRLGDLIAAIHKDNMPEVTGVYADMLNAAFDSVDWTEIADMWLDNAEDVESEGDTDEGDPDEGEAAVAASRRADAREINARALNEHLKDIMGRQP